MVGITSYMDNSQSGRYGGYEVTGNIVRVDAPSGREPGHVVWTQMRFPDGTTVMISRAMPLGADQGQLEDERSTQAARMHTVVVYWDRFA